MARPRRTFFLWLGFRSRSAPAPQVPSLGAAEGGVSHTGPARDFFSLVFFGAGRLVRSDSVFFLAGSPLKPRFFFPAAEEKKSPPLRSKKILPGCENPSSLPKKLPGIELGTSWS